jgi:hypothetical protein
MVGKDITDVMPEVTRGVSSVLECDSQLSAGTYFVASSGGEFFPPLHPCLIGFVVSTNLNDLRFARPDINRASLTPVTINV